MVVPWVLLIAAHVVRHALATVRGDSVTGMDTVEVHEESVISVIRVVRLLIISLHSGALVQGLLLVVEAEVMVVPVPQAVQVFHEFVSLG